MNNQILGVGGSCWSQVNDTLPVLITSQLSFDRNVGLRFLFFLSLYFLPFYKRVKKKPVQREGDRFFHCLTQPHPNPFSQTLHAIYQQSQLWYHEKSICRKSTYGFCLQLTAFKQSRLVNKTWDLRSLSKGLELRAEKIFLPRLPTHPFRPVELHLSDLVNN